jgi:hypothetical protein
MTTTNSHLETTERVLPVRDAAEPLEDERARATLEQYLTLLDFRDRERARLAEQVMRRLEASGHTDRVARNVMLELHRVLAGPTEPQAPGHTELAVLLRSIRWRAAARVRFSWEPKEKLLTGLGQNGSNRFSAVPLIERRPMVPDEIEYVSWRGIRRSFIAWLLGKPAPAEFSLGRIPGK